MGGSGSKSQNQSGFTLDCIVSQAELDQENPLYRLVNYHKGGSLLEAHARGGSAELERVARELLPQYMYQGGKGSMLMPDDFKHSFPREEVVIAMDLPDPSRTSRKVCWRLDTRGFLGESIMHVLVLCNSAVHTRIALVLLRLYPALALDIIEGPEYYGASALHLSIAYHNEDLILMLIESRADVNQRAMGRFFLPADQQGPTAAKNTNYDGLFYLGEYPLAWAAGCEDETTYNLLITQGADPNMPDMFGNMVLHVVVIRDKLTMYGCALHHPTRPAKEGILNRQGLSPLSLACKLGRNRIFREMMDLGALEFWRYSNITCSGYPLSALDTLLPNGKTNWNSALILILNGKTSEHLAMLDGGVIQKLLEEKWKTFARRYFMRRLALMLLHLLMLSLSVFLRPRSWEPLLGTTDAKSICRYVAETITLIGCFSFVIVQPIQEIMAQGIMGFLMNLAGNPAKVVFLLSSVLIMLCVPHRVLQDRATEDLLLAFALPGSWFFLLFFAGAMRLTGPFVTMIYSMLGGDMVRFSIIYIVILIGFTQAFYFLFKSQIFGTDTRFTTYMQTWVSLFQMTLGSFEFKELRGTYYKLVSQLAFTLFMVMTPILLLNMLIAMMGNTYMEVIEQSEREWMRQWAKVLVTVERAISSDHAREYVDMYSIKLPAQENAEDPTLEQRAVLVIRARNKSKARQRKGALTNWKRLGRKIVRELRRLNGNAERLREKFRSSSKLKLSADEAPDDGEPRETFVNALTQLAFTEDRSIALDYAMQLPPSTVPSFRDASSQTYIDVRNVFVQTAERRSHRCKRRGILGTAKVGDSSDLKVECSKQALQEKTVRFHLEDPKYDRRQKFAESKPQPLEEEVS